jgi:hypothetical protein
MVSFHSVSISSYWSIVRPSKLAQYQVSKWKAKSTPMAASMAISSNESSSKTLRVDTAAVLTAEVDVVL